MKPVRLNEAEASLTALVDAAVKGQSTMITRDGKPAAMVVPVEKPHRVDPDQNQRFIDHLLKFPGGIEFDRNDSQLRDFDF